MVDMKSRADAALRITLESGEHGGADGYTLTHGWAPWVNAELAMRLEGEDVRGRIGMLAPGSAPGFGVGDALKSGMWDSFVQPFRGGDG